MAEHARRLLSKSCHPLSRGREILLPGLLRVAGFTPQPRTFSSNKKIMSLRVTSKALTCCLPHGQNLHMPPSCSLLGGKGLGKPLCSPSTLEVGIWTEETQQTFPSLMVGLLVHKTGISWFANFQGSLWRYKRKKNKPLFRIPRLT